MYLLAFIDDFSCKILVFFLAEKSKAFVHFKLFKVKVEKAMGTSICGLRIDRGGEFMSQEFHMLCQTNGIQQLTTAYTPQHNGVVEQKNRTTMDMVRSMLTCKQVPKIFLPKKIPQ